MNAKKSPTKRVPRRSKTSLSASKRGQLIVFEGPDGVGKSTLAKAVTQILREHGQRCRLMSFPGRDEGTLGQLIYRLHHDPASVGVNVVSETARQALHVAAHIDALERTILPTLASGEHVLLDRFWWSTLVYGKVGGISESTLKALIAPELRLWSDQSTTLFLVDRDSPINRDEDPAVWKKIREQYAKLADQEKKTQRVSNTSALQDAVRQVLKRLPKSVRPDLRKRRLKIDQISMPFQTAPEPPQVSKAPTVFCRLRTGKDDCRVRFLLAVCRRASGSILSPSARTTSPLDGRRNHR